MSFFIVMTVLLLFASTLGFIAGSAENRPGLWKRFRIAAAAVILAAVTSALFVEIPFQVWKKLKSLLALPAFYGTETFGFPEMSGTLAWWGVAGVMIAALLSFLIAFNCRHIAKNLWLGLGATLLAFGIICVAFMFLFYGSGAFMVFSEAPEYYFPHMKALSAAMLFIMISSIIWTLYAFFGKSSGWRILTLQLAIFSGSAACCWLLALATAFFYAENIKSKAEKMEAPPISIAEGLPEDTKNAISYINAFYDKHAMFALPYESIFFWTATDRALAGMIPDDRREYTLKLFDSPEMRDLCTAYESMFNHVRDKKILYFPLLNYVRSYARIRAGRAALFSETRQPEKILPEVMKITVIDEDLLNDSPFIISELVRIACRTIWYDSVVRLGPDNIEYAPVYRQALDIMKSRKVHLSNEAGYFLNLFDKIKIGNFKDLLTLPYQYAMLANQLSDTLEAVSGFTKLENQEIFSEKPGNYENIALRGRVSIVMGTTAMALKCYRVEHGKFPDTLDKLVPEYMDKIPVCPFTGLPLQYDSDGKDFTLSLPGGEHREINKISSHVRY